MTKKHFIALADDMRSLLVPQAMVSSGDVINALARFCQSQNPHFKRERWIAYINGECGKNGGKISAKKVNKYIDTMFTTDGRR